MNSRFRSGLLHAFLLICLPGSVSAGYLQFISPGPVAAYDSVAQVFSITGLARAQEPRSSFQCNWCIDGYQALVASVDQNGVFSGGTYSFVGSAPSLGIDAPTLLLSASITNVSVVAHPGGFDTNTGTGDGGLTIMIHMITEFADPVLVDWDPHIELCCEFFYGLGASTWVGRPLTQQTLWASSWSGPVASDYFDLTTHVPAPGALSLVGLGLLLMTAGHRRGPPTETRREMTPRES